MNKALRNVMLLVASVVFLSVTPFVVLYAIGYRLNPVDISPSSVGVLFIETIPRRAAVDVNGQYVGRSPRLVPSLVPGKVAIKASLEGYVDWMKTVSIEPTMAAEFRSVRLFPQNPKRQVIHEGVQTFSLSPHRKLLAVIDDKNALVVYNEAREEVRRTAIIPDSVVAIHWSADSSIIVLQSQNTLRQVAVSGTISRAVTLPAVTKPKAVHWDPRSANRLFIVTQDGRLVSYTLSSGEIVAIASNVSDSIVSAKSLYIATQSGIVDQYDLQGRFQRTLAYEVEEGLIDMFIGADDRLLFQYESGKLDLVNEGAVKTISQTSSEVSWSPDGQLILIQTGPSELQVYNASEDRLPGMPVEALHLVTRLSREIHHPAWFAGGRHLLYQIDDEIIITEIDTRDHPISYTVDTTNTGNAVTHVGEDGNVMYYIKQTDNVRTLTQTSLIVE